MFQRAVGWEEAEAQRGSWGGGESNQSWRVVLDRGTVSPSPPVAVGLVGRMILGGFQKTSSLQTPPVLGEVPKAGLRHS